jgi:hypothetical protein
VQVTPTPQVTVGPVTAGTGTLTGAVAGLLGS